MLNRRRFLHLGVGTGFGAIALGISPRQLAAATFARLAPAGGPGLPLCDTDPLLEFASQASVEIGGVPFAPIWFGDTFPKNALPFHQCESCAPTPEVDESVDVAIVGGGLSGLASAWLLRDRKPVLFELRSRFGGNAMGEQWNGLPYSLGSAYFIVPDRGSRLESMYSELGLLDSARIDSGPFTFEWNGAIEQNPCVQGCDPLQIAAVDAYRKLVAHFAFERYPDIPLPEKDDGWIRELDRDSLKSFLDAKVGPHLPPAYAAAIQAYCYSSFGIGWDELSAAAAWNFIAAEEFGRVVLPGGNAGLARAMWSQLRELEQAGECDGGSRLRAGCLVEGVRLLANGKVEVRWREPNGKRRTLHAKHVIMAMIDDLATHDGAKANALPSVQTVAYLVANVRLKRPLPTDIYDLFLLHNRRFPMDGGEFELDRRIVDALDGTFALKPPPSRGDVLTLYWPLPWHSARFTIIGESDWMAYAELGASQIRRALEVVGLSANDIEQVRLTRWGHAMPYAQPGQIADGIAEIVRRPIAERIWFVNQDNWLLPAVETCLEEAFTYTDSIRARLDS
jgi:NAD(P)-binding Rossmann-like domain